MRGRTRNPLLHLELGHHIPLGILGHAPVVEQALCEVCLVVPLKHVLVVQEAEQHDRLFQDGINLVFRFLWNSQVSWTS